MDKIDKMFLLTTSLSTQVYKWVPGNARVKIIAGSSGRAVATLNRLPWVNKTIFKHIIIFKHEEVV